MVPMLITANAYKEKITRKVFNGCFLPFKNVVSLVKVKQHKRHYQLAYHRPPTKLSLTSI